MVESIIRSFDVWTSAQGIKSKGRVKSIENISLEGIAHLRELILELAIRGKLVPQDAGDEPASVLLERIAKKKGTRKRNEDLLEIEDTAKAFEIPKGWEWIRLSSISEIKGGKRLPHGHSFSSVATEYVYIQVTNMKAGTIVQDNLKYISKTTHNEISNYIIEKDDLYITIAGTIGQVGVVPDFFHRMNLTENAARIIFSEIDKHWLQKTLSSNFVQTQFEDKTNQLAQPKLALHRVGSSVIPLPPLPEQARIVAKVESLMALCDRLEKAQTTNLKTHQTLVKTLLQTLTEAADAADVAAAWQRLCPHFDTLFCTEDSIDQLAQTVLQLAIMGRLVPQDAADEPAGELLKRIEKEKARLVKEGKLKKGAPLPEIREEEKPFALPEGWEWCRLGAITNKIGSGSTPRGGANAYVQSGVIFLRSQNVRNEGLQLDDVVYIDNDTNKKMANTIVEPDDILLNITGGSLGRSTIFPASAGEANVSQHVTIIRPVYKTSTPFLHLCILSPYVQELIWGRQVGANREGLSKRILELFEFPLPPFAEQKRIVAKVESLTALCDHLKARLKKAEDTRLLLSKTIVENAVD